MKKANDIYSISTKLIKIGASKLKLHIAFIFNQCIIHGVFSDKLKKAMAYPIHKGKLKTPMFKLPTNFHLTHSQ